MCTYTAEWLCTYTRSSFSSFLKNLLVSGKRVRDGKPLFGSISTLKLIRAAMKRCCSPTTMMFEQGGHSCLKLSSMGTGATFSPPAVIIGCQRQLGAGSRQAHAGAVITYIIGGNSALNGFFFRLNAVQVRRRFRAYLIDTIFSEGYICILSGDVCAFLRSLSTSYFLIGSNLFRTILLKR